jgi:hypothetical protein
LNPLVSQRFGAFDQRIVKGIQGRAMLASGQMKGIGNI